MPLASRIADIALKTRKGNASIHTLVEEEQGRLMLVS